MAADGSLTVTERLYPEVSAGGFTRFDGTVHFFNRVNALLNANMTVLDFGAGRGLIAENETPYLRELSILKGKVQKVVGVDVDPIVLENTTVDEQFTYDGKTLPFADAVFDMIVCDHVFEHLENPQSAASELSRVLKPGGWICARTPHLYSILATVSRCIPNRLHSRAVKFSQPGGREEHDVFPTRYQLNSARAIRRYFRASEWRNYSYTWSPEPGYHAGSIWIARILAGVQWLKRPMGGEVFMIFLRKFDAQI